MGTFFTSCRVTHHVDRDKQFRVPKLLVDSGSEYSWLSATRLDSISVAKEKKDAQFVMANGEIITRNVGFVILHVEKYFTIDEVVFAAPGDLLLLGAHTLKGLNLMIDTRKKCLVAAGPMPVA